MYLPDNTLLQGGKYKILRHISNGGFGCTYEAIDTMMDTRVAIKEFFVKDYCNRDEATKHITLATQSKRELIGKLRKKFLEEARAIFQMKHDNIVRVYSFFEENNTAYYVMEFIEGESLGDMLKRRGSLPETEALGYIRQVADALRYVHSKNRLHLDIKPGNIMIDKTGNAILIDFGASKHYDEGTGENTTTMQGLNTPGYAPYEQTVEGVTDFKPASDIYALGATLYKVLTGVTPPNSGLIAINKATIVPLPECISDATKNATMSALQLHEEERPQSVDAFMKLIGIDAATATVIRKDAMDEDTLITVEDVSEVEVKENDNSLEFDVGGIKFKMIKVAGGTFDMREKVSSGFLGLSSKEIVQKTTLSDYSIGETQVTQALWKAVMGDNPSHFRGENLPVECVSWNDCQVFLKKLTEKTGKNFRLPAEAEWEFAAHGGNMSNGFEYSGSNYANEVAWFDRNSDRRTHDVATKQSNELGIYDMSGNVWEWCSDWYGNYSSSSQTNPIGPNSGSCRVFRGGSWRNDAWYCRSSLRSSVAPDDSRRDLGLRLVLVP